MANLYYPERFFTTTLSSDLTSSATTVSLTTVPSDVTTGYMVIEPSSATKREVVHFTSVGASSVTTADDTTDASDASGRGCAGSITAGANTEHSQGVTVIIAATEQYWKRIYNKLTANDSDGIQLTEINDSNGNEEIKFTATGSAINELTISNAAAGNNPIIEGTGGDTDVGIELKAKGAGDIDITGNASANIQVGGADPTRGIYIPAQGMFAATTSGAASGQYESSSNKNNMKYFAFDNTADEYVHFSIPSPHNWDAGTITAQFYWTTESGGAAETVDWGIQGVATANDDTLDVAYGTGVTVTDTWIADNDQHITSATSAVTIAGSPTAGEWLDFRIYRDTSEDDLGGDAWLLGVRIAFSVAQYNDA